MINVKDILETIKMIEEENLDIRTITMGISLLDCADSDIDRSCEKIYDKITKRAERLVPTGEEIEADPGIPINSAGSASSRCVQILRANMETLKVETKEVHITGYNTLTEKQLNKAITSELSDNEKFVNAEAVGVDEVLYGMPEQDFIKYAKVLPPR